MNGQPKCGCGKSLHQPYCDGSHARNEQQYKEWQRKVELEQYQQQAQELWADSCTAPRKTNGN
jgi:CDGSH-type Zn-finger protein